MSDLIPYNETLVPPSNGLENTGVICYFNAMVQCLLACPSIAEVLQEHSDREHVKKNLIAQAYMALHRAHMARSPKAHTLNLPLWRHLVDYAEARGVQMRNGQQDAHEGLMMFLDVMETVPEVNRLFTHRYNTKIKCMACDKWVVDQKETNTVFHVQANLKSNQNPIFQDMDETYGRALTLQEIIYKQNESVDDNFKCSECGDTAPKYKTTMLTMVPEILPVLLKKYEAKENTEFPLQLVFPQRGSKQKLIYELVGQIEHSGGRNGGHYKAISKRGIWQMQNDMYPLANATPGPTPETYVVFYHYMKTVETA